MTSDGVLSVVELRDRCRLVGRERQRVVPRLEPRHRRELDLLAGFDVGQVEFVDVDRVDLDAVDHEHAGVAALQVDDDVALVGDLNGFGNGDDRLDERRQVRPVVAGDADEDTADHQEDAHAEHEQHDHRRLVGPPPALRRCSRVLVGAIVLGGRVRVDRVLAHAPIMP